MLERFKGRVLAWMKVPHEPEPPLGAPGSVRVFRAGLNHYRIRVLRWGLGQVGAVIGIGFSLFFLAAFELGFERARQAAPSPSPAAEASPPVLAPASVPAPPSVPPPASVEAPLPASEAVVEPSPTPARPRSRAERRRSAERAMSTLAARTPPYVIPLIEFIEVAGIALFLAQLLVSFAVVLLEFEQHWYIVTDRSLRIRTGILRLQESTMSFANIQQVEIRQGPLQRVLGLADVCVRSAGGGDPAPGAKGHAQEPSLHTGVFEGVANALEIRDLILERLRKFREAGLGDPEDPRHIQAGHGVSSDLPMADALAELLAEARALRHSLTGDA